tara:strand:+ start:2230 stop:3513 length:1284 start_codon:yes stop_codon:yes gene_type:complete
MGLFKAIGKGFKAIGKGFKAIGKGIMKGFRAVGKFVNKLGIFGQIGMALIMPGIANFALSSLSSLGSGFMSSLVSKGWVTVAGQQVAAKGVTAGLARVTHAVLQGSIKAGTAIAGKVRSITDAAVGLVTDSGRAVMNSVGVPINPVQVTDAAGKIVANPTIGQQLSQGLQNSATKLETGWGKFKTQIGEIRDIATNTPLRGNEDLLREVSTAPRYETFTEQPAPSLLGERDPRLVTREVGFDSAARESFEKSPEYFARSSKELLGKDILKGAGYDPTRTQVGFPIPDEIALPEGMPAAISPEEKMGVFKSGAEAFLDTYSDTSPTKMAKDALTSYGMHTLSRPQVGAPLKDFAYGRTFDPYAGQEIRMATASRGEGVGLEDAAALFSQDSIAIDNMFGGANFNWEQFPSVQNWFTNGVNGDPFRRLG